MKKCIFVGADTLDKLIEASYRLMYLRLPDENYILNSLNFACLLEKDPDKIDALCQKPPPWIMVTSIGGYGKAAKDQFDCKEGDIHDEAGNLDIELLTEMVRTRVAPR